MTEKPEPNRHVMLLTLGLTKVRLVSASDPFSLISADEPFIPVPPLPAGKQGIRSLK